MTTLFSREYWQGRLLLLFSFLSGVLVVLANLLLEHLAFTPKPLAEMPASSLLAAPVALAFLTGAGLFAAESDRGTLPLLLALPLSRGRIWLAKGLAGLALALTAALLYTAPGLAASETTARAHALAYLPDVAAWALVGFAAALFCSTLAGGSTAALLASLMLAGGVAGGASWLVLTQGAPLLGYGEALDIALWSALAVAPALLIASLVTLRYGELLHSSRKWLFAFTTLFAMLLVMVALVSGVARFATRYQRSEVVSAGAFAFERGTRPLTAVPVFACASHVARWRDPDNGWVPVVGNVQPEGMAASELADTYRAQYLVVVDPTTRRDLLHLRLPVRSADSHAAVSPDGARLAVVTRPLGLTWGARRQATPVVEVYALPQGRRLSRAALPTRNDRVATVGWISWSATGRYFAMEADYDMVGGRVLLYGSDGTLRRDVGAAFLPEAWSGDDALYGFARDTLYRVTPDSPEAQYVWSPGSTLKWQLGLPFGLSADGTWLAFAGASDPSGEQQPGDRSIALWALNLRTHQAQVLLHETSDRQHALLAGWPGRGETLAVVLWDDVARRARRYQWRPGEAALTPVGAEITGLLRSVQVLPRPGTDDLVLWMRELRRGNWPDVASRGEVLIVDAQGRARRSPAREVARYGLPTGFDTAGRFLYADTTPGRRQLTTLRALDLTTGKVSEVYP